MPFGEEKSVASVGGSVATVRPQAGQNRLAGAISEEQCKQRGIPANYNAENPVVRQVVATTRQTYSLSD